jgi:(p)ppGpp synthase/HD superfamily hydrolase
MSNTYIEEMEALNKQYETAKALAIQYHDGQVDAGGEPYINHLMFVSEKVMEQNDDDHWGYNETDVNRLKASIVGLLHDILEDTDCTADVLKEHALDDDIIEAVQTMSHQQGETYFEYLCRVEQNPISKIVKIADLEHNMDVRRLKKFGEYEKKRIQKYWASWKYLKGELGKRKAEEIINKK